MFEPTSAASTCIETAGFIERLSKTEGACSLLPRLQAKTSYNNEEIQVIRQAALGSCNLKKKWRYPNEEIVRLKHHMMELIQNRGYVKRGEIDSPIIPQSVRNMMYRCTRHTSDEVTARMIYEIWEQSSRYTEDDLNLLTFWDCVSIWLAIKEDEVLPHTVAEVKKWFTMPENQKRIDEIGFLYYNPKPKEYKLTKIPAEIKYLPGLTHIAFEGNAISEIPPEVGMLTNLEILDLKDNKISCIPATIGKLPKLHTLRLNKNSIDTVDSSLGNLQRLKILELKHNKLKEISPEFLKLKSLTYLELSDNQIEVIPPAIQQLARLEELNLALNAIQEIPKEIAALKCLFGLELSHNKLIEIPNELGKLKGVRKIDLSENAITSLPIELIELLKRDCKIDLSKCPIIHLQDEFKPYGDYLLGTGTF